MFNNLKIKMTLLNIVVIGSILVILSLMIYVGSPHNDLNGIDQDMFEMVMKGTVENSDSRIFKHHKHSRNLIIVDTNGNIIKKSIEEIIDQKSLEELVKKALIVNSFTGEVKLENNSSFVFIKAGQNNKQEINIAFKNSKYESQGVLPFFFRSIFAIIMSLMLVFFGSMIIAGKALVPINKSWQKQVDFTADASHELRTPISVIQTNIELVLGNEEETVESQKKWLENILVENARMARLVEDLLTLSRSDVNQNNLYMENFLIDEVLKEAIIPVEPLISGQGKTLTTNFNTNAKFYGDKNRIKQLVIILLDNAIKYTGSEGVIEIVLVKTGRMLELTVSDNGEGIEKEHLDKIFDRFYRIDKARSRNKGGSGLGLSIAKWIVQEHNGSINAESDLEKGTKFIVQLPIVLPKQ